MKIKKKVICIGGESRGIVLPRQILTALGIDIGDVVELELFEGKEMKSKT